MINKFVRHIVLCLLLLLSSCITEDEPTAGNELVVGDKIPSFSVVMDNGEMVGSEDLFGKVSLIVFFNTSCKDCQQELPVVQQFYESFPQYPLLCISREETEASVARYWKQTSLTIPYSAQADRTVYQLFARQIIPRIYVVDKAGIIRYIFTDSPLATYTDLVGVVEVLGME